MKTRPLLAALAVFAVLNLTALAGQMNAPIGRKVMLLSSAVAQGDVLVQAARDDVAVIHYEPQTTTMDNLVARVRKQLGDDAASSIAFVNHDYGENKFYLTRSETISLGSSLNSEEQQSFWKEIGALVHPQGRIDLFACNLAKGDQGGMLISTIERLSNRNIAASTNKTGNPTESADWILETDAINAGEYYFDSSRLERFTGELISLERKLVASSPKEGAHFGISVSISGTIAVVGSPYDDYDTENCGSAHVFVQDGAMAWVWQQQLGPTDGAPFDDFGRSVSIYGNTAVIGSPYNDNENGNNSGAAYVFVRNSKTWTLQVKLTATDGAADDRFGTSVSIYHDTLVVGSPNDDVNNTGNAGAPRSGSSYVFVRDDGGNWTQQAKLTAPDGANKDYFGTSVSIYKDTALVGAYGDDDKGSASGSAYVFVRHGLAWNHEAKLTADDGAAGNIFGDSVSIYKNAAVVGASQDADNDYLPGSAYVFFRNDAGTWVQNQKLTAAEGESEGDNFGHSVSLSGDTIVIGAQGDNSNANNSGTAYVFIHDGETWERQAKLYPNDARENHFFGSAVCTSVDTILVGAYGDNSNAGSAYLVSSPRVQETTTASEITSSSVLLGGVILEGLVPVTERGVIIDTNSRLNLDPLTIPDPNFNPDTGTGEFTIRWTGLEANTIYYYCAYVTSNRGSYFGNVLHFATLAVHTVTAIAATPTGADPNGQVQIGPSGEAASTVSETVDHGNPSTQIYATSNEGYHFVEWRREDNLSYSTDRQLSVSNVVQNMRFTAVFAANAPEIQVRNGITEIPNDSTGILDLGIAQMGEEKTGSFVISNADTATATLELTGSPFIAISGEHADDFSVIMQPVNAIAKGERLTVEISFTPSAQGERNALVTIATNDPNNDRFRFDLQGRGISPEIRVMAGEQEIVSEDSTPSQNIQVDFGDVNKYTGRSPRTFVIANSGNTPLSLSNIPPVLVSGPAASDFGIEDLTTTEIAPNSSASFNMIFDPSDDGPRQATMTIYNNDLDEGEFSFTVQGQGISPKIEVLEAVKFGSKHLAGSSIPKILTIRNSGNDTLSLDPSSPITISGEHAGYFTFDPLPATPLGKDESMELTVYYMPALTGNHSADLTINGPPSASIILSGEAQLPSPIAEVNVDEENRVVLMSVSSNYNPGSFPDHAITYSWEFKYGPARPVMFPDEETYQGEAVRWDAPADGIYRFELTVNVGDDESISQVLVFVGEVLHLEVPASVTEGAGTIDCELYATADLAALGGITINSDNQLIKAPTSLVSHNEGVTIIPFKITVLENDGILHKQDVTIAVKAGEQVVATAVVTVEDNDGPRIRVYGSGTEVPNGHTPVKDNTTFRKTVADSRFDDQEFSIKNKGYDVLRLSPVLITGDDPDDFEVLQQPAVSNLGIGEETTFVVRFRPLGTGADRHARIAIPNNDEDASDYHFNITGAAIELVDRRQTGSGKSGGSGACGISSAEQTSTSLLLLLGGMIGFIWFQSGKTQTNSRCR